MKLKETKDIPFNPKAGGRKLKGLMEQRGVTQEELSEATGVPPTLISRLWWGTTQKPDLGMMTRIYGAFGLSPNRAAEDYGCYSPTSFLNDPRIEDIQSIIQGLSDEPEKREELIRRLYFTTKVFLSEQKTPD